eukprot:CAMPEP_0116033110 /NCGR_PEP_ID=MMETSP0321-20121206/18737_1 /TAXON_ID=163516 /ORGANISM="Leptocylindrus danicus var. danicus, Strain B650" /LENGTH=138 /DNA_ID=CAMNT_0003509009 /DNA_START=25 /DNA_END=441 /DNA_ORIENTATION=-
MPKKSTKIPTSKQLQIKVKSCERLKKEHQYYIAEVAENEAKLAKMKQDNADKYDIKRFAEVLEESHVMVPDSLARLNSSLDDLMDFLHKFEPDLVADEDQEWLEKAKKFSQNDNDPKSLAKDEVVETNVNDLIEGEAF